jgi:hypothetical protein
VQPGAIVNFSSNACDVYGSLVVVGTDADSIGTVVPLQP